MRTGSVSAGGYTYVVVLAWIALVGIGLAVTGELWSTTVQREREAELLFIGEEYRRALNAYYQQSPGLQRFPRALSELVRDERFPGVRRHLRRIYVDPMTGKNAWGLVKQPDGGIVGVHSLSTRRPLRSRFEGAQENLDGKQQYAEWVFRADAVAVLVPAGSAQTPAAATHAKDGR